MSRQINSIKEIASIAGLSIATVSRVINKTGSYSARAEETVNRIVKEYNYSPNLIARGLKTNSSKTVGIIIPNITGEFFARATLQIQLGFFQKGYSTIILNTNHDDKIAAASIQMLKASHVCGLINFTGQILDVEYESSIPVVYFDRIPALEKTGKNYAVVTGDNYSGGAMAAEEFLKKGTKNLRILAPVQMYSCHQERVNGFRDVLLKHGVSFSDDMIIHMAGKTPDDVYDAITKLLLSNRKQVGGYMSISTYLALAVLKSVKLNHLQMPSDFGFIAFDLNTVLQYTSPSITSVQQDSSILADSAVNFMIELLQQNNTEKKQMLGPVYFQEGDTT